MCAVEIYLFVAGHVLGFNKGLVSVFLDLFGVIMGYKATFGVAGFHLAGFVLIILGTVSVHLDICSLASRNKI